MRTLSKNKEYKIFVYLKLICSKVQVLRTIPGIGCSRHRQRPPAPAGGHSRSRELARGEATKVVSAAWLGACESIYTRHMGIRATEITARRFDLKLNYVMQNHRLSGGRHHQIQNRT